MMFKTLMFFHSRLFLGDLAPYEERQLWYLHCKYGASTRALARHARDPTDYELAIAEQLRSLEDPRDFGNTMLSPYTDDSTNLCVIFEASETSRAEYQKNFSSKPLFEKFWNEYLAPLWERSVLIVSTKVQRGRGWVLFAAGIQALECLRAEGTEKCPTFSVSNLSKNGPTSIHRRPMRSPSGEEERWG